jgi:hypothetical protein
MTTTQKWIGSTTFGENKPIYKPKFTELTVFSEPQGEYGWTEVGEHGTSPLCTYFIYFLRRRKTIYSRQLGSLHYRSSHFPQPSKSKGLLARFEPVKRLRDELRRDMTTLCYAK